jgi:transposase
LYIVYFYDTKRVSDKEAHMFSSEEFIGGSDVGFLPIVSAYAAKLGIVEEIDKRIPARSDVSCGRMVLAFILDALSGRSPLFRLERFFADKDVELLVGKDIPASKFNDDALGRVLDRLFDYGTNKILTAVALNAVRMFDLNTAHAHYDTTSHSVYGDFDLYQNEDHGEPFVITHGFSKAHRPDLKQLIQGLLCVDHGIPVYSKCESGNESDKILNGRLLDVIVEKMRALGQEDFVYIADSAAVTEKNLTLLNDPEKGCRFLSRLPAVYKECGRVIAQAVEAAMWTDFGAIAQDPTARYRDPAHYRGYETEITLHEVPYRVLVAHSDAHDERRTKRLDKQITRDKEQLTKLKMEHEKIDYACLPDALAAAARVTDGVYHRAVTTVHEKPKYGRGRPKAAGARTIKEMRYRLTITLELREEVVSKAREEAGCFVLITNVPAEGERGMSARELLVAYKDQHIVERNFGFLKDPVIVNSLFLKTPKRIEALGLILVLALMVWRLMERTMRRSLLKDKAKVEGWNKQKTARPTSFMMTTMFVSALIIRTTRGRVLTKPLTPVQKHYLEILDVSEDVFAKPVISGG